MPSYFAHPEEARRLQIFPGVEIQTLAGEGLMLSLVVMEPGAVVERHAHPHEQMGMLLEGELTFTIGEETRTLHPGEMWRIPGGVPHGATAGPAGCRALDLFHPVREDYR